MKRIAWQFFRNYNQHMLLSDYFINKVIYVASHTYEQLLYNIFNYVLMILI